MKNSIADKVVDPTADMMRNYLKQKLFSMYDFSEFDIEGAIYWFATFHHSGMMSNLYSASSTSKYSPSRMASGPCEESLEKDAFDLLESQFIG
jgi:hypothetical protein